MEILTAEEVGALLANERTRTGKLRTGDRWFPA